MDDELALQIPNALLQCDEVRYAIDAAATVLAATTPTRWQGQSARAFNTAVEELHTDARLAGDRVGVLKHELHTVLAGLQ